MLSCKPPTINPARTSPFSSLLSPKASGDRIHLPQIRPRRRIPVSGVRAVINREDKSVTTLDCKLKQLSAEAVVADTITVRVVLTVRSKLKEGFTEKIEGQWESFINGIGQGITVQLVSEDLDQETNSGKLSVKAFVKGWLPKPTNYSYLTEYTAIFSVSSDFGRPGAVIITNLHSIEFYLTELIVHGFSECPVIFPANSWIHSRKDNMESRVLFSNKGYLPSQTPSGLKALRQELLIRNSGTGEEVRKKFELIYDYAKYNDLGKPDKDTRLSRPTLGGLDMPYPRRCRTGRPPAKSDPSAESRVEKPHSIYVPRDEDFEEIKKETFSSSALRALFHNLIPAISAALSRSDNQFECFSDIDKLYMDGIIVKSEEKTKLFFPAMLKSVVTIGERLMKYDVPSIISRDRFSWLRDHEFARQTLAGVNPVTIERLRDFPIMSKLDPAIYGAPESAITRECIEYEIPGMTVEEINAIEGRKTYASRTIFFHTRNGILRPIAIELSLPPTLSTLSSKIVYTHGHDATTNWIWKLAKAHVCTNDAGIHQLVSHWLRTHACMEPYIIASHRQLSTMHPVFKLLHPHMRYTMEINALARQSLINGGGIIEGCFTPGPYSMELSSAAYKRMWRFDMEALPADLLRRGMAVEDPSMPRGIRLVIEDYPYAADGLLVWSATEDWVRAYINHIYLDDESVKCDVELQSWWDKIKTKGHEDKKDEPWWPSPSTKQSLANILTIIIWTASGQHAAINFGQYPFGGYMPNRPTLMKKLIPREDEPEYLSFLLNPQQTFLASLPSQLQATHVMAVQDTLSTHSLDEEYLGKVSELHRHWTDDERICEIFDGFSSRLGEIEEIIKKRNEDLRLKNRSGAGVPPYELLIPSSGPGVTGRGIPNSISI